MGFHCSLTYKAFVGGLQEKLKDYGVSPAQFVALAHLTASGPLAQSELADLLMVTAPTAARLVDRMERDGWVYRQVDQEDGRVRRVYPTSKAKKTWAEVSEVGRNLLKEAYKGIPASEVEAVKKTLERVRRNLTR